MNEQQLREMIVEHIMQIKRYKRKMILAVLPLCVPVLLALDSMVKGIAVSAFVFAMAGALFVLCSPVAIWSAMQVDKHRDMAQQKIQQLK